MIQEIRKRSRAEMITREYRQNKKKAMLEGRSQINRGNFLLSLQGTIAAW